VHLCGKYLIFSKYKGLREVHLSQLLNNPVQSVRIVIVNDKITGRDGGAPEWAQ
jgi:hypothetical protein